MHDESTPDATLPGPRLNRRRALQCLLWSGSGALWALRGGVPTLLGAIGEAQAASETFSFVQISDTHVGFNKAANPDTQATLQLAIDKVRALQPRPTLMLHTGDVSHLSKPEEFDTAAQLIGAAGLDTFYVPGEHDVLDADGGALWRQRYGRGTQGGGWYSFEQHGVHFIGLVNVLDFKPGGLGRLGSEQLDWLARDVKGLAASTPIVVFAHIPLWTIYADWGWGTDDAAQALALLRRFGSVTVLNGHIHQTLQKVEGQVSFHTAFSTAYPQPAPGSATNPGPLTVPAERLRSVLGIRDIRFAGGSAPRFDDLPLAQA
ncbi:metallophosphoesterase family protein [Plasticicumulans acidivorans]|uniref:Calcineurin-like phosphoesterase family protein n=1 Tax=Plasticicumulans acidivorans TaxID=886464 RepID=A0A317MQ82_9GAMM|nr:metallophosphoesterase [Plasticicumulans acidivorans]PWV58733.1 calcineurin-like phosphoesterase family protein [Plasticicumulans acidivorans]